MRCSAGAVGQPIEQAVRNAVENAAVRKAEKRTENAVNKAIDNDFDNSNNQQQQQSTPAFPTSPVLGVNDTPLQSPLPPLKRRNKTETLWKWLMPRMILCWVTRFSLKT